MVDTKAYPRDDNLPINGIGGSRRVNTRREDGGARGFGISTMRLERFQSLGFRERIWLRVIIEKVLIA